MGADNIIAEILKKYLAAPSVVFVFPSEIAARMWQEKALDFMDEGVLPDERFAAWDQFKCEHAEKSRPGYTEIPDCARDFYAERLMERNARRAAETGEPLLKSLVPRKFAEKSGVFSPWLSGILPGLEAWSEKNAERHTAKHVSEKGGTEAGAGDAADLAFIKKDYQAFLDAHRTMESSWSRRFDGTGGKKYLILFPEAMEDFSDYTAVLAPASYKADARTLPTADTLPVFSTVSVPPFNPSDTEISRHENFREEFTRIALLIEKHLMAGAKPETIAVSLNNREVSAPYFMRELHIRGIPAVLRAGHTLGKGNAGRIFSLIKQCAVDNFSFQSLKNLLYVKTIPWNSADLPVKLIQFGIDNHCVSSWKENGAVSDIWENAFKTAGRTTDVRLAEWYKKLKRSIKAMTAAKTFSAVRSAWFIFRKDFLDVDNIKEEDDREIARCVEELTDIITLEKEYEDCLPKDPFSFFVNRLNKKVYVPKSDSGGVSVFPYRVAAGTPFDIHFVAGVSQEDSTVVYQQLKFLRRSEREKLLMSEPDNDKDASEAFFSLYSCGTHKRRLFFSSAKRAVDGYKTPHKAFYHAGEKTGEYTPPDPFEEEESGAPLSRMYPVQKSGYAFHHAQTETEHFSFLKTRFPNGCQAETIPEIEKRMQRAKIIKDGKVRVSSKDLHIFAACASKWFLEKILALQQPSFSAELMNERHLGLVFHSALKNLYTFIREQDGRFLSGHMDVYMAQAARMAEQSAQENIEFKGPLTAPILSTLAARITEGLEAVLREDAEKLDGAVPLLLERELSFHSGDMEFFGTIDRMSVSQSTGTAVLIDYKSGAYPKPKDYKPEDGTMGDFQIPMYILLAENSHDSPVAVAKQQITQAWIFSIKEQKYKPVLNCAADSEFSEAFNSKTKPFTSVEQMEPAIETVKRVSDRFRDMVRDYDFSITKFNWDECASCAYKEICRHTYAVNPKRR